MIFRKFLTWIFSRGKNVSYFSLMTIHLICHPKTIFRQILSALPNITTFKKLQLGCDAECSRASPMAKNTSSDQRPCPTCTIADLCTSALMFLCIEVTQDITMSVNRRSINDFVAEFRREQHPLLLKSLEEFYGFQKRT